MSEDQERAEGTRLRYDERTVAALLADLQECPAELRLDSLAAAIKVFVEDRLPRSGELPHGE